MIQVNDSSFEIYIEKEQIAGLVQKVAELLNQDYSGKDPLVLSILNGAFVFTADLVRALTFDPEVSFVKLASYTGMSTTGQVDELIGLKEDISGRHILIVEDIVDTGNTLQKIIALLKEHNPASIEVVSLLIKSEVYNHAYPVKYFGADIPNRFVIGYGLDYDGKARSLPHIYQICQPPTQ